MFAETRETLDGLPPAILEELKRCAERSQLRQLRRLQQLQKQALYAQERDRAWRQKEEESYERERRKQREIELEAQERAQRQAAANARRVEHQNQAEQKRIQSLTQLQYKLDNAERRSECMANRRKKIWMLERTLSRKRQEKRELVKRQNDQLLEGKRDAMFSKQRDVEEKLAARNQAMEEGRRRLCYEKHLAEIERQKEALSKAAQQEETRRQHFLEKQRKKDLLLEHMQQEKEAAARIKAEKTRIYQDSVKERLAERRYQDQVIRERQNMAFEEKVSRAGRIERQREMVRDALSSVRRAMLRQEEAFRKQLDQAKFVSFDDMDLTQTSTLIASLTSPTRPRTARGRLEYTDQPDQRDPVSPPSEGSYEVPSEEEIQSRAKELKQEIDEEIMKELEMPWAESTEP